MQALRSRKETAPYSALAAGYDAVMAHVDYVAWAAYAHERLHAHHPDPRSILELGCGTGSLALALQPRGPYRYRATDGSAEMIRIARRKAAMENAPIRFEVADFTDFRVDEPVEAVVLLYDGLNYLLEGERVRALLRCAYEALKPGGLFLFDQSTPANSINNADFFEDEGRTRSFTYRRRSQYDKAARLHTTTFFLTVDGTHVQERHVQRAYHLNEIRDLVRATSFEEGAAYDAFSTAPATDASERIHWILRRP
jgi:SAM-dependent methyltransferase